MKHQQSPNPSSKRSARRRLKRHLAKTRKQRPLADSIIIDSLISLRIGQLFEDEWRRLWGYRHSIGEAFELAGGLGFESDLNPAKRVEVAIRVAQRLKRAGKHARRDQPGHGQDPEDLSESDAFDVADGSKARVMDPGLTAVEPDQKKLLGRDYRDCIEAFRCPLNLVGIDVEIDQVEQVLIEEMPNFTPAIAAICSDWRLRRLGPDRSFRMSPILLIGPPGVGKTRFCRRLAELIGLPSRIIMAAGLSDSRDLAGTARGWGTAQPSAAVRLLAESGTANPIIVVDEIEKAGGSAHNGRIHHTLLQLFECGFQ
jgi:hypothetical protein